MVVNCYWKLVIPHTLNVLLFYRIVVKVYRTYRESWTLFMKLEINLIKLAYFNHLQWPAIFQDNFM